MDKSYYWKILTTFNRDDVTDKEWVLHIKLLYVVLVLCYIPLSLIITLILELLFNINFGLCFLIFFFLYACTTKLLYASLNREFDFGRSYFGVYMGILSLIIAALVGLCLGVI